MLYARAAIVFPLLLLLFAMLSSATGRASRHAQALQEEQEVLVAVELRAVNIDERPLEGALVEAYNATMDGEEQLLNSSKTNSTGWAKLYVQNGSICTFKVFWREALVGVLDNVTVAGNMTIQEPVVCSVCDLIVRAVGSRTDTILVGVDVDVSGNYTDRHGNQVKLPAQKLRTNVTGLCSMENVLMNCTYRLRAYRHGVLFNETVIGPLGGTTALNITCPRYLVRTCVVDGVFRPIRGAEVMAWDWGTGELLVCRGVDERGLVDFWALPGKCLVRALLGGETLSEMMTIIDKNETLLVLVCRVHNYSLTVRVVDARGNPIPGLEVRLIVNETVIAKAETRESGEATFTGLSAPLVEIEVYSGDELLAASWADLRAHRPLVLTIGDRILIFGDLVRLLDLVFYSSTGLILSALALILVFWSRKPSRGSIE